MKGYKGFKHNGLNFFCLPAGKKIKTPKIFPLDKVIHQKGKIRICKNGIHFCKTIDNVLRFYKFNYKNFYCEIKAEGEIVKKVDKYCCSKLSIVKFIPTTEVLKRCGYKLIETGKKRIYFEAIGCLRTKIKMNSKIHKFEILLNEPNVFKIPLGYEFRRTVKYEIYFDNFNNNSFYLVIV